MCVTLRLPLDELFGRGCVQAHSIALVMRAFCRPLPQTSITTVSQPASVCVCRGVRSASTAVAAGCGFLPVLDFLEGLPHLCSA